MADLDKESLKRLFQLARIDCGDEEQDDLLKNLQKVLGYVAQLQEVDTEGIPPCDLVLEGMGAPLREDEIRQTLDRDEFLKNAPAHIGGMIRVPPVIQQGS